MNNYQSLNKSRENLSRGSLTIQQYCFLHFADCSFQKVFISKNFPTSTIICLMPPSRAPFTRGTTIISYSGCLSLVSQANCLYLASFSNLLASMFHCWGHAMSQIHIFFFALSSRVKSGLLVVVVLRRWNSKSHKSFPLSFSSTAPHSHRSLY